MIYFHQMCDVFFGSHNPSPPRPKTPFTHAVHVNSDIPLSKGHLGSRWGKHLKQTQIHQFHLSSDKRHGF